MCVLVSIFAESDYCTMVGSGGTAFNGVVEELKKVTTRVAHVLPVSDDGGSTAEIVRVLGSFLLYFVRSAHCKEKKKNQINCLNL